VAIALFADVPEIPIACSTLSKRQGLPTLKHSARANYSGKDFSTTAIGNGG
jgi:hypothetical protein